jgi:DNA (cytosine-5)-methyltransferase 1
MKAPLTPQRGEPLRVVELFAGVGGFRIALEGFPKKKESAFEVVWSNQFEPRSKIQHANIVYKNRFPNANHSEEDIEEITSKEKGGLDSIPEHDLLVGGFPCQDFSIANRSHGKGIEGKKGKLWWSINTILKKKRPSYILLENVNRLLCSPVKQKGRDFAIILSCLNKLGYAVEWRVINAAEYGFPQRRRRVFIVGYHQKTSLFKTIQKTNPEDWILKDGVAAKAFPAYKMNDLKTGAISENKKEIMSSFLKAKSLFENAGLMLCGKYYTLKVKPMNAKS